MPNVRQSDLDRRRQIAALRAQGLTSAEIGWRLGISPKTVAVTLRWIAQPRRSIPCAGCGRAIESACVPTRDDGHTYCLACVDKDPKATFGQRLKAFRLAAGLTLAELARRSGVVPDNVRWYELGTIYPRDASRAKLALAMGLTLEQLGRGGDATTPRGWGRPRKQR
jgi:hypothetical protein